MTIPRIEANIFSIQKFSTEDGPGIRTTVFFKGCPMRCPWCHNPEAMRPEPEVVWHSGRCLRDLECIAACPEEALRDGPEAIAIDRVRCTGCGRCVEYCPSSALEMHGRTVTIDELFEIVARDKAFYEQSGGGVTLSGGEPLVQSAACAALLRLLRENGIHTAVDTCGAVSENVLRLVLEWTDLVLFDVKTVDAQKHLEYTGIPFSVVETAAHAVAASGVEVWVRTPVIPGYTDSEGSIREVAGFVAATFPRCTRHDLLAFSNLCTPKYAQLNRPFALARVPLLHADDMERLCAAAREEGSLRARWSGPTRLTESEARTPC